MERPILFSTPMVQAILDGCKIQTRRIVKPQPTSEHNGLRWEYPGVKTSNGYLLFQGAGLHQNANSSPYGSVGDVLWVRETFTEYPKGSFQYKASTANGAELGKWKPSIHMPKAATRIWLEIINIRIERLENIRSADCINEGISKTHLGWKNYDGSPDWFSQPRDSFRSLWQSINGEESWESNPWVWVIEFKRINK